MEVIKQRLAELLLSSFTYCLAMLVALTIIMQVSLFDHFKHKLDTIVEFKRRE